MPTNRKPRTLILCFDGTSNEFDKDNTNVVKFFSMLKKDRDDEQLCYYQTGIGTYTRPGIFTPILTRISLLMDKAIAWYLNDHVMGGYRFLMQNYCEGDRICLFGFSRGAYTARALAGMLTKVGVLPRDNTEQVTFAYKMYTRTDKNAEEDAAAFKQCFSRHVEIEFLGVWDTVASTGIIISRNLPFTNSNTLIKTFRHALALDEHRSKFVPTFYHADAPSAAAAEADPQHGSHVTGERDTQAHGPTPEGGAVAGSSTAAGPNSDGVTNSGLVSKVLKAVRKRSSSSSSSSSSESGNATEKSKLLNSTVATGDVSRPPTDVKEVWFVGCHSDIGGGNVANTVTSALSDIPLRWMVREIIAADCGIQFDAAAMERARVHMSSLESVISAATSTDIRTPEDTEADNEDAMRDINDEMKKNVLWWLLEIIPLKFSWQDGSGKWVSKWRLHFGRGRYVQQYIPSPVFHGTVQLRTQNQDLKYKPRAKYAPDTPIYVI